MKLWKLLVFVVALGCEPTDSNVGDTCAEDSECGAGLVCVAGSCAPEGQTDGEVTPDEGRPDAADDATVVADAAAGRDAERNADSGGEQLRDVGPDAAACQGGEEVCNGRDDDCDGEVDEGFGVGEACSAGLGVCAAEGVLVCNGAADGVVCDAVTGERGEEVCNGLDDDCDGETDEGFPLGQPCHEGVGACETGGTFECVDGAAVCDAVPREPVAETCNGVDDDCDGEVDDAFELGAPCSAGVGPCMALGVTVCDEGGAVVCDAVPGDGSDEVCDGADNDCDGETDEGFDLGAACDVGLGVCAALGRVACAGDGQAACDAVPGQPAAEVCNGLDDDCDGDADEDDPGGGGACEADAAGLCVAGVLHCIDAEVVCVAGAPAPEICDALDQDCDGEIDDRACCGDAPVRVNESVGSPITAFEPKLASGALRVGALFLTKNANGGDQAVLRRLSLDGQPVDGEAVLRSAGFRFEGPNHSSDLALVEADEGGAPVPVFVGAWSEQSEVVATAGVVAGRAESERDAAFGLAFIGGANPEYAAGMALEALGGNRVAAAYLSRGGDEGDRIKVEVLEVSIVAGPRGLRLVEFSRVLGPVSVSLDRAAAGLGVPGNVRLALAGDTLGVAWDQNLDPSNEGDNGVFFATWGVDGAARPTAPVMAFGAEVDANLSFCQRPDIAAVRDRFGLVATCRSDRLRVFYRSLGAEPGPIQVASAGVDSVEAPAIAADGDGFAVAWTDGSRLWMTSVSADDALSRRLLHDHTVRLGGLPHHTPAILSPGDDPLVAYYLGTIDFQSPLGTYVMNTGCTCGGYACGTGDRLCPEGYTTCGDGAPVCFAVDPQCQLAGQP